MRTDDLQHQNAVRLLQNENVVLLREMGKAQQRITALLAAKAREFDLLQAQLLQACAALAKRDTIIGLLRADLSDLRSRLAAPPGERGSGQLAQPGQPSRPQ